MPNSAYLYASDEPEDWEVRTDERYSASRWLIPLAWLFFSRPEDIRLIEVASGNSRWQEVKFTAEKRSALALFELRKRLLLALIQGRVGRKRINEFSRAVANWPAHYLILQPGEVVEDDLSASERYAELLRFLDAAHVLIEELLSIVRAAPHVKGESFSPEDRVAEGQILGFGA